MAEEKYGFPLLPHQEAVKLLMEQSPTGRLMVDINPDRWVAAAFDSSAPKIVIDSCAAIQDDEQTLRALNAEARRQAAAKATTPNKMFVLSSQGLRSGKTTMSRKILEDQGVEIIDEVNGPDPVESDDQYVPAKPHVSQLVTAMLAASLGIAGGPFGSFDPLNPFAALEPRTLTPEEAKEAFKTSDAERERRDRAEAKRQRKAAKLNRGLS
jgi:hypothetical protein